MAFVAKIIFEEEKKEKDIRRIQLQSAKFEDLITVLQKTFGGEGFSVKYEDNDGDSLTISSTPELEEAFRVAVDERKTLKLVVSRSKKAASQDPSSPEFVSVGKEGEVEQFSLEEESKPAVAEENGDKLGDALVAAEQVRLQSEAEKLPEGAQEEQAEKLPEGDQEEQAEHHEEKDEKAEAEPKEESHEADGRKWAEAAIGFLSDSEALQHLPGVVDRALNMLENGYSDAATFVATLLSSFPERVQRLDLLTSLHTLAAERVECLTALLTKAQEHMAMVKVLVPQLVSNLIAMAPELVQQLKKVVEDWGKPELNVDLDFGKLTGHLEPLFGAIPAMMAGFGGFPFTVMPDLFKCRGSPSGACGDDGDVPSASSSSSSGCAEECSQRGARPVHAGVTCDGCGGSIVGVRFKCTVCIDFDLCETCEGTNRHAADHPLMKFKVPAGQSERPVPVHVGVRCDGCGAAPIRGIRYKCAVCDNFDLCEPCEKTGRHPDNHPLIVMKINRRGHHGHGHGHRGPLGHGPFGRGPFGHGPFGRGPFGHGPFGRGPCGRPGPHGPQGHPEHPFGPGPHEHPGHPFGGLFHHGPFGLHRLFARWARGADAPDSAAQSGPEVQPGPEERAHRQFGRCARQAAQAEQKAEQAPQSKSVQVEPDVNAQDKPVEPQVDAPADAPAAPASPAPAAALSSGAGGVGGFLGSMLPPFFRRPAPAVAPNSAEKYEEQLRILRDMGFGGNEAADAVLIQLLHENKGDVARVALVL